MCTRSWFAGGQWNVGVHINRRSSRLDSSAAHSACFVSLALRTRHSADFPVNIVLRWVWLQRWAKINSRQLINVQIAFIFPFIFIFRFLLLFLAVAADRRLSDALFTSLRNWWMFSTKHLLPPEYGQLLIYKEKDVVRVCFPSGNPP